MATATPAIKFTIRQYDRMIEAGVFALPPAAKESPAEPPRIELIEGEIVMMSPIGPRHEEIVDRLNEWSVEARPQGLARVRVQQSLGIAGSQSVPQPDIAWVRSRDYASMRPDSSDAFLVIEVAETSRSRDLGEKAAVYAAGEVPDYWVVDMAEEVVHVFRLPGPHTYAEHRIAGRGESVSPLARPKARLLIESLFDKRS